MTRVQLSDAFYFVLDDGDVVWPSTMSGDFRLVWAGKGHNILGIGEHPATEAEMIKGVLEDQLASRFRSKSNPKRMKSPNHFKIKSPSVKEVHVKVGSRYIRR